MKRCHAKYLIFGKMVAYQTYPFGIMNCAYAGKSIYTTAFAEKSDTLPTQLGYIEHLH